MTQAGKTPENIMLASMYRRLDAIEPLIRIVIFDAEISALLTFRGEPETTVLLDYSKRPGRISIDGGEKSAKIYVTIDGRVMHDVLSGKMTPGTAIARREMLLRGSAGDFARFIPMLDFGALLYVEHLSDICAGVYARRNLSEREEAEMKEKIFSGDPVPLVETNAFERAAIRMVNAFAYAAGYAMGVIRHRILKKLSLFDTLTSMSRGLEAATPSKPADDSD